MNQQQDTQLHQAEQHYLLATTDAAKHRQSYFNRRLPIALPQAPRQVCGIAYRVGWIQQHYPEHPIYRLRLRMQHADYKKATLPGFFILENGVFVKYVPAHKET